MKRYLLLAILACPLGAIAQTSIYLKTIAGSYRMSDMKGFQHELEEDMNAQGLPVKEVSSFPMSLQGELGFTWTTMNDNLMGAYFGYAATRGKLQYKDYSGEVSETTTVARFTVGINASAILIAAVPEFSFYGAFGMAFNFMELETKLTLQNQSDKESTTFSAVGIVLEPGLQYQKKYQRFNFTANAGYEFNFNGKTNYKEDYHLLNRNDEKVIIDWSGMRIGLSVGYILQPARKKTSWVQ
jgi:hypothetical protein